MPAYVEIDGDPAGAPDPALGALVSVCIGRGV
jgi:hypothetical protein